MPSQDILTMPSGADMRARQREGIKFWFLCAWILSYTIALDLRGQLKGFDLMLLGGLLLFRTELQQGLHSRIPMEVALRRLAWIVSWGAIWSVCQQLDEHWAAIIALRYSRFLNYFAIFLIIRHLQVDARRIRTLVLVVFLSVLVQAVLILLQQVGLLPVLWPEVELEYRSYEYSGTLYLNHLNSVMFMSTGMCAGIGLAMAAPSLTSALLFLVPPFFMAAAMLAGRARSAFIALAVFLPMLLRRVRVALAVGALALIALPLLNAFNVDLIGAGRTLWEQRVLNKLKHRDVVNLESLEGIHVNRSRIWIATLEQLADRPHLLIMGAGFQNFESLGAKAVAGHNLYLHTLVELGVFGLFFLMQLFYAIWRQLVSMARQSPRLFNQVTLPGTTCLAAILAVGLLNESFYPSRALPGYMGFALAYFALLTHNGWLDKPTEAA